MPQTRHEPILSIQDGFDLDRATSESINEAATTLLNRHMV